MPRRALFSLLIALTGTLATSAAPVVSNRGNSRFEGGRNVQPGALNPAGLGVLRPAAHQNGVGVIRANARPFALGSISVLQPAAVAVSLAGSGRKS